MIVEKWTVSDVHSLGALDKQVLADYMAWAQHLAVSCDISSIMTIEVWNGMERQNNKQQSVKDQTLHINCYAVHM